MMPLEGVEFWPRRNILSGIPIRKEYILLEKAFPQPETGGQKGDILLVFEGESCVRACLRLGAENSQVKF